jgi:hypothetical protein
MWPREKEAEQGKYLAPKAGTRYLSIADHELYTALVFDYDAVG